MRNRSLLAAVATLVLAACADRQPLPSEPRLDRESPNVVGGVFTTTNDPADNRIVAYSRASDGMLTLAGTYSTGGRGIGGAVDPLQSQFALVLSRDAKLLFAVSAGSNEVSAFAVDKDGLTLVDKVGSGGVLPTSVTASKHVLYVLNAGSRTIATFRIGNAGTLAFERTYDLAPGAVNPAAIRISQDGHFLAVTVRGSGRIDSYVVAPDGSLSAPVSSPAAGAGPFGFDFTPRGQLITSDAGSGSASSYAENAAGGLDVVSGAVSTGGQRAPCWLIVGSGGRFAYTANAGSASISAFSIAANGELSLVAPNAASDLGPGAQPLDLDVSRNGKFLYVLENGTGTIGVRALNADGTLGALPDAPGLVARGGFMGIAAY